MRISGSRRLTGFSPETTRLQDLERVAVLRNCASLLQLLSRCLYWPERVAPRSWMLASQGLGMQCLMFDSHDHAEAAIRAFIKPQMF